jgi:DNA-directed RNA polymerase subunit alpha
VRRVMFEVEPTRVEQSTNYDRLVLDIETDGSVTPADALASAGATLRSLAELVSTLSEDAPGLELGEVSDATSSSPDLELPIEDLDLSERPRNSTSPTSGRRASTRSSRSSTSAASRCAAEFGLKT